MKAKLVVEMALDWHCWPILPATGADRSATTLTRTQ